MKKTLLLSAFSLAAVFSALAQENLPREECLKYAFIVSANLKELLNTPIATDPDIKRPVAVKDEDYGAMVLPEAKLSAAALGKLGKEVQAVGQLWMVKLVPLNEGQMVPVSKLRQVHLSHQDQEVDVVCCALGVRADNAGKPELLIYGKGTEPVMRVPLTAISAAQDNPIEISAERKENGGLMTLRIAGKFQASFLVTDPDKY